MININALNLSPLMFSVLTASSHFKYLIVFVGMIIEGPIIMVICGFLLKLQVFTLVPIFTTLVVGDLLADIVWYYLGYFFLDSFIKKRGRFLSVTPELIDKVKMLFHKYHVKILLISKVTIGLGLALPLLMVAGASRVPIKSYILLNAIGELVLVSVLLSIGYFFATGYALIASDLKIMFLFSGAIIVLVIIFGYAKYLKTFIKA